MWRGRGWWLIVESWRSSGGRSSGARCAFWMRSEDAPTGLSLSEISRRSGVPLTTTHRIVAELLEWGALERDRDGGYRIGLRLWEVAALAPRSVGLQRIALPFMQDLYETTHRGVHLAVREKDEVVFVERFVSPETVGRATSGGWPVSPCTPPRSGWCCSRTRRLELQEDVMSGPLTTFTPMDPPPRPVSCGRRLPRSGAPGTRSATGRSNRAYVSVAAPIYGPDNTVVAALSLIVPHAEPHGPSVGHLVQATARGISRALGAYSATRGMA